MNRRLSALAGLVGALVSSGVAWAATSEPNALLTEGYDAAEHNLVWGVAEHPEAEGSAAIFDCRIEGTYTYEFEGGKVVMLAGEGGVATYQPVDEAADPVPYGETGDECVLTVTNVEGPNGQVNHGTIVSSFVHALKEAGVTGVGCYVRFIAGSSYGKGAQQVQVGEVIPPTDPVTSGEVTLATHEARCGDPHVDTEEAGASFASSGHGNGHGNGHDNGNGHGKPPWAGQGGGRP